MAIQNGSETSLYTYTYTGSAFDSTITFEGGLSALISTSFRFIKEKSAPGDTHACYKSENSASISMQIRSVVF